MKTRRSSQSGAKSEGGVASSNESAWQRNLVRGHADSALEGLVKNLAEGGVGVHHPGELLDGGAGGDGVGALLDEIRCVHADDVHTEHLASVLVEEALGDAGALELCKGPWSWP